MNPFPRRVLIVLACVLAGATARAQGSNPFLDEPPGDLVRAAYETEYGRSILVGFGAILRDSADPACARGRGLDAARLTERGAAMLRRHGTRTVTSYLSAVSQETIRSTLAARGEPDAMAEIVRLRADPDVRALIAIDRRAKLAAVVDMTSEMFTRGAQEVRAQLSRPVSPVLSGDQAQLALNPLERTQQEFQRFVATSPSPRVARYVALATLVAEATVAAVDQEAVQRVSPIALFQGFDGELAALCVRVTG